MCNGETLVSFGLVLRWVMWSSWPEQGSVPDGFLVFFSPSRLGSHVSQSHLWADWEGVLVQVHLHVLCHPEPLQVCPGDPNHGLGTAHPGPPMAPERGKDRDSRIWDRDSRICLPGAPEHCSKSSSRTRCCCCSATVTPSPDEETSLASRLSITSKGTDYSFKTVKYRSRDSCEPVAHNCMEGKGGWFRQRCQSLFSRLCSLKSRSALSVSGFNGKLGNCLVFLNISKMSGKTSFFNGFFFRAK